MLLLIKGAAIPPKSIEFWLSDGFLLLYHQVSFLAASFKASRFFLSLSLDKQTILVHISILYFHMGDVVQLVRTPACQAGGRGFKSRHSRFIFL